MQYRIRHHSVISTGTSKIYDYDAGRVLRLTSVVSLLKNTQTTTSKDRYKSFLNKQTQLADKIFRNLEQHYGFHFPDYSYSVEQYYNVWHVVTLQEKIIGENLFKIELKDIPFSKVRDMLHGYTHYLDDTIRSNEPLWADFKLKQFMYGTTQKDNNPQIYLVDIEPLVYEYPVKQKAHQAVWLLEQTIEECSRQYGPSVTNELQSLINQLPKRKSES